MIRLAWLAGMLLVAGTSPGSDCVVKKRVVYEKPNGIERHMTLYLPKESGTQTRPAVVLIHGGSWFFGTRRQLHWYGERLAERGYVAAAISYRMMPEYPFPCCLYDCKAAVRWLRLHAAEYGVDPDRIGALGNSAGGHLVAMLAMTRPEDGMEGEENLGPSSAIQTALVYYGVADLGYYRDAAGWINMAGISARYIQWFVGAPRKDGRDAHALASPVTYARADACPVLFVHGTKDSFVPRAQSISFHETLRELGVPTRLITVTHGHAFDFFYPGARARVFNETAAFLDEHLGRPRPEADR